MYRTVVYVRTELTDVFKHELDRGCLGLPFMSSVQFSSADASDGRRELARQSTWVTFRTPSAPSAHRRHSLALTEYHAVAQRPKIERRVALVQVAIKARNYTPAAEEDYDAVRSEVTRDRSEPSPAFSRLLSTTQI